MLPCWDVERNVTQHLCAILYPRRVDNPNIALRHVADSGRTINDRRDPSQHGTDTASSSTPLLQSFKCITQRVCGVTQEAQIHNKLHILADGQLLVDNQEGTVGNDRGRC